MPDQAAIPDRCRLVLIAPLGSEGPRFAPLLQSALAGGDVASLLLPSEGFDENAFQALAEAVAPIAQGAGVALIVAQNTRVAGRVGADGIHLETRAAELAEAVEHFQPRMAVGAGGAKTRDDALALGETRPDYLFFGRFGFDNTPGPHPRNLTLGRWWSEMIQIPCIVMGGSDIASVGAVAETGAEFVALSRAVFADGVDPREAVARANAILDDGAPRWGALA